MASASLQAASMRHCAQQSVSQPGLESWMYLRDWFAVLTRAFLLVPDREQATVRTCEVLIH